MIFVEESEVAMQWWYRIQKSKTWLFVLLAISVVGAVIIGILKFVNPRRIVRETRKIKVPVPETDHVEEYRDEVEKIRYRRVDRERDPARLSAKVVKLEERRRRGK